MTPHFYDLRSFEDERGALVPIEAERTIPFPIRRVFYVHGTPPGVERGFHAHRTLQQVAIAVAGSCEMVLDDGREEVVVTLDSPKRGLAIPPRVWHVMRRFSPDCVLLVLAEHPYDEADYLRSYEAFRAFVDAG